MDVLATCCLSYGCESHGLRSVTAIRHTYSKCRTRPDIKSRHGPRGAEAVPSDVKRNLLRCLGALPLARVKYP